MEYIEPKPIEPKPHAKRNKIIIAACVSAFLVAAITLTYYFLISRVFIEKENIDLLTYSYRYDVEGSGVRIDGVKEGVKLPSTFRIPNKLDGRPVVEIADDVFSTNDDIKEMIFPDSLQKIGNNCFADCTNLEKFNIPENLVSVGTDAFLNTKWLDNHEDGEVAIGKMLYTYKGEMDYPACIVKSTSSPEYDEDKYATILNLGKYNEMSSGVFKGQKNLIYAEIPEAFTSIYESLFEDCENLEKVVLHDGISIIEGSAFSGCLSLNEINIPDDLTYLGELAFAYTSLSGEITIPSKLDYMGSGVFKNCKQITSVSIPYSFSYIPDCTFQKCEKLEKVTFDESEFSQDSRLSYIGENAFEGTSLVTLHVPFNVTSIKKEAFKDCSQLEALFVYNNEIGSAENIYTYNVTSERYEWVKSNDSYQGILKFETGVFNNASKFTSLVLVNVDNAEITSYNKISVPITCSSFGGSNEDSYFFSSTSIKTIDFSKDYTHVEDETYIAYLKNHVLSIVPPSLCENATKLETIIFGDEIKTINRAAFKGCTSLQSVFIDEGVTVIETSVFEQCTLLSDVTLPTTCDAITSKMFYNCSSLVKIDVPSNYKTIGQYAFGNCQKLTTVNFGVDSTLTNIGEGAFSDCICLKSLYIPDTCNALASSIFSGCTAFEDVTLPYNTTISEIAKKLFYATGLKTIVIPSNYKSILDNAFANCLSLTSVTLQCEQVVSLGSDVFLGDNLEHIYVPSSLLNEYQSDVSWSSFASIIEPIA